MLNQSTRSSVANSTASRLRHDSWSSNQLRLVKRNHRLGERVVERIPLTPDRRREVGVREAIRVRIEHESVRFDAETRQPTRRRAKTSMTI